MSQSKAVQDYISFVNGWVAEGGPFAQVGQAFLDGANVVVNPKDGSVTRRKGLAASGSAIPAVSPSSFIDSCRWVNVGPNTDDFVAVKIGSEVFFFDIGASYLSSSLKSFSVDLHTYRADSATDESAIAGMRISMASAKGRLFIAGPLIETLMVSYSESTDDLTVTPIAFKERDFDGIDRDIIASDTRPATYTATHIYNLTNAGWPEKYIQQYKDEIGVYPSRAMSPWPGVQDRIKPSNGYIFRVFRPKMFIPEEFGTSESPRGHFTNDIFNTQKSLLDAFPVGLYATSVRAANTVNNGDGSYTYDLIIRISVYGGARGVVAGNTINISGFFDLVNDLPDYYVGGTGATLASLINGTHLISARHGIVTDLFGDIPTHTEFDVTVATGVTSATGGPAISDGELFLVNDESTVNSPGAFSIGTPNVVVVGDVEPTRFGQVAVFSGRVFYAGCPGEVRRVLKNRIYYSQSFLSDYNVGRCYQENDPTARDLNEVVDTDGGYIEIPDMGLVLGLAVRKESIVALADNGVWEIKSGEQGYFTPTGYVVRKVSDFGMSAHGAFGVVDGVIVYHSAEGIKVIKDSEITALSEGTDLSGQRIRSYLEATADYTMLGAAYDFSDGILYFAHSRGDATDVIAFDFRLGCFYKHTFDTSNVRILGMFCGKRDLPGAIPLFFVTSDNTTVHLAQLSEPTFVDSALGHTEDCTAFVETRYEIAQDSSRKKSLDRLVTFMAKEPNASAWVRAKYEWTTDGSSGKWNNKQQAYRDRGVGYDVAVSRLRMRGSGRSFRLRWESEAGKPFTIYGYAVVLLGESEV